jgi:hypothetical protein
MRVIVAGCRHIHDTATLYRALDRSGFDFSEVVVGGAPGVDTMAEDWALMNDIPVVRFDADWKAHGRAAGPIRNGRMVEYGDALIAVWDGRSAGTRNAIGQAQRRGLLVHVEMV